MRIESRTCHVAKFLVATPLLCSFMCVAVSADIVHLTTGGVLRGIIDSKAGDGDSLTITLMSGAEVEVPVELVSRQHRRPLKIEQYEVRAESVLDTVAAHWEMAEWCREKNLSAQREIHLEIILDLDPAHRKAHYGLKHTYFRKQWMTRDEYEQTRRDDGFVFYNGKWIAAEKLESFKTTDAKTKAERKWYAKVRLWLNWAAGSHPQRAADGLSNLRTINSPEAVPSLVQFLGKSQRPDVRSLFIEIVGQIEGPEPIVPLTTLAIREDVRELRERSLSKIGEAYYEQARKIVIVGLRDRNNVVVRRSGIVLAKIGDETSVPALIRALVTSHTFKVRVPVQSYSYGVDGSMAGGAQLPLDVEIGLRTGVYDTVEIVPPILQAPEATKLVPVTVNRQNNEVLIALRKITGQDFGFNENAWQRWWEIDRNQAKLAPDLP